MTYDCTQTTDISVSSAVQQDRERIDQYWAQFLGCEVEDLRSGQDRLVYHRGSPGLFSLTVNRSRVISLRPGVPRLPLDVSLTPDVAREALAPVGAIEEIYGPAVVMYGHKEDFRPRDEMDSRLLDSSTHHQDLLRFAKVVGWQEYVYQTVVFWDYAFGIYREGELASVATATIWGGILGALKVATAPDHRRKGFGGAVVSAATRWMLENTRLIPQYDTASVNTASRRLGVSLGYREYGSIFYGKLAL